MQGLSVAVKLLAHAIPNGNIKAEASETVDKMRLGMARWAIPLMTDWPLPKHWCRGDAHLRIARRQRQCQGCVGADCPRSRRADSKGAGSRRHQERARARERMRLLSCGADKNAWNKLGLTPLD